MLAMALSLSAGAGAASAHDQLLSSSPAEEAVVPDAPTEITMVFSDGVLDIGGVVVVADAEGTDWADGALILDGNTVTQKLKPGAPDGAYQVRWRVVSADGHPISDVYDYSVGDSAAPAISSTEKNSSSPQPSPAPTTDSASAAAPEGIPIVALAVGGAALGLAVYAAIILSIRRRTKRP